MQSAETWISMGKDANTPSFRKPQQIEYPEHVLPSLEGGPYRLLEESVYKLSYRLPKSRNAANLIESLWDGGMEASFDFPGGGGKMHRARVLAYTEHTALEFDDDSIFEIYLELDEDMLPPDPQELY